MQHLEFSGAVRPLKWSLGVKWLNLYLLLACELAETGSTPDNESTVYKIHV